MMMRSIRRWLLAARTRVLFLATGLPWRSRAVAAAVALLACLAIGLGVLRAASNHSRPRALAATPTSSPIPTPRVTPLAVSGGDPSSPANYPTPAATPLPTATLPAISGVGARLHLYPRAAAADLTLGGGQAAQLPTTHSVLFTPDPRYVAEDTLTDTGPGPPGPLSGLPTRPELAHRRPLAVIIDNFDPDARPQAGLNRASAVFETVAEGGITRFMAIYLEKDAPIVGPVRSARIYFDAWAAGLHAIYAHAGGNNDALAELPRLGTISNVDGLAMHAPNPFSWDIYWRSTDRVAPHNFYTSTAHLRAYADATAHADVNPVVPTIPHKEPAAWWVRPKGGWIHISFSTDSYSVQYRYDPRCNCYARSMNGQPHIDAFSLRQIAPTNVVVLSAGVVADPASDTPGSVNVQSRGFGRALYFRDGTVAQGFWHKGSAQDPLSLLDARGQPVAFDPGQTWFEVVPIGNTVTWSLQ